jgi:competence protein ComX
MQEIIQFLVQNADVLQKVQEGTASLIGVSSEEVKAILEVFFGDSILPKTYFWQ